MASLTITVPDPQLPRLIAAVSARNGYQAILNGSPNPQSPADFVRQHLTQVLIHQVKEYEAEQTKATNDIQVTVT